MTRKRVEEDVLLRRIRFGLAEIRGLRRRRKDLLEAIRLVMDDIDENRALLKARLLKEAEKGRGCAD
jgi:hypothetical protein